LKRLTRRFSNFPGTTCTVDRETTDQRASEGSTLPASIVTYNSKNSPKRKNFSFLETLVVGNRRTTNVEGCSLVHATTFERNFGALVPAFAGCLCRFFQPECCQKQMIDELRPSRESMCVVKLIDANEKRPSRLAASPIRNPSSGFPGRGISIAA
jgi:hypothetical protein